MHSSLYIMLTKSKSPKSEKMSEICNAFFVGEMSGLQVGQSSACIILFHIHTFVLCVERGLTFFC